MRQEHSLAVRFSAAGIAIGGIQLGNGAHDLGIQKRSLERWLSLHRASKGHENQGGGRRATITLRQNHHRQNRIQTGPFNQKVVQQAATTGSSSVRVPCAPLLEHLSWPGPSQAAVTAEAVSGTEAPSTGIRQRALRLDN